MPKAARTQRSTTVQAARIAVHLALDGAASSAAMLWPRNGSLRKGWPGGPCN